MNAFAAEEKNRMHKQFEIHWDDLTKECQERIEKLLDSEANENNNWKLESIMSIYYEVKDPPVKNKIQ